jgi:hypothetical protein
MKRNLAVFVTAFILFSCKYEPELVFEEPQPNVSKDQKKFGKEIQGRYFNPKDSSSIIIDDKSIIRKREFKWNFLRSEIDSGIVANIHDNNLVIEGLSKAGMKVSIIDDSIFSLWTFSDTLFLISQDNILRQMRTYYFLNTKIQQQGWKVMRLEIQKKKFLKFSRINPLDSLERFEEITHINKILDDSGRVLQFNIKPTKKELKKLMKEEAFVLTEDVYTRTR